MIRKRIDCTRNERPVIACSAMDCACARWTLLAQDGPALRKMDRRALSPKRSNHAAILRNRAPQM
jgi:hypothetical protein